MSKIGLRAPGISLNHVYIRVAQAVGDLAGEGDVDDRPGNQNQGIYRNCTYLLLYSAAV